MLQITDFPVGQSDPVDVTDSSPHFLLSPTAWSLHGESGCNRGSCVPSRASYATTKKSGSECPSRGGLTVKLSGRPDECPARRTRTLSSARSERKQPRFHGPLCCAFQIALPFNTCPRRGDLANTATQSEEHTSELQSPCNLVCRLLLEK